MSLKSTLMMFAVCALAETSVFGSGAVTAPTRYVSIDGNRIAYRSLGNGPPIVLATRLRGTLDTWDPLFLDLLAQQHRVIIFDYPGIGYSAGTMPADLRVVVLTLAGLARELDLQRFTILGWSWGGLVAQTLAVEHPDLVTAVILVATNPPGDVPFSSTKDFLERAVKPVNDLADEEVLFFEPADAASRDAARRSHDRIFTRSDVTGHIPSRMEQFQPYFIAARSFREDKGGLRMRFLSLATPKLIITGDNDTSTQGQNWFPIMGEMRNSQFVMYSQTGHAPHHQHPERVVDQIEDFLAAAKRGKAR